MTSGPITGSARRTSQVVVLTTLAGTLMLTSLAAGGYSTSGQRVLLACTALLVLELIFLAPAGLLRFTRVPLAWVLGLLSAWTAASALWTVGAPADAIRWAAVTLDLGVLVAAGAVITRWLGASTLAAVISATAVLEAGIGTWALALRHIPEAVLVSDSWRPGGNFEYAPALSLLEICALPFTLMLAASPRPRRALAGAGALALFGVTLGTEDSRGPLALVLVTLIVLALKADRRRLPRRELCGAALLLTLSALGANLLLGRPDLGDHPGSRLDVLTCFAGCALLAVAWLRLRRFIRPLGAPRLWAGAATLVILALGTWALLGYTSTLTGTGGGLDHSRFSYWSAALRAWHHHLLLGSGAESFFAGTHTFQLQNDLTLFAHNLPLELAAELGIPGFVLALALYGTGGRDLTRWLRAPTQRAGDAWLLAPTSGAFLIQNLFDWPWHFAALGAVWALAAGGLNASLNPPGRRGGGLAHSQPDSPHLRL